MNQQPHRNKQLILITDRIKRLSLEPLDTRSISWISSQRKRLKIQNQTSMSTHKQHDQTLISNRQIQYIDKEAHKLQKTHFKLFRTYGKNGRQWQIKYPRLKFKDLLSVSNRIHGKQTGEILPVIYAENNRKKGHRYEVTKLIQLAQKQRNFT